MERRSRPRPQRVLVVDDSADIRELWRLWLTFWGFSVEMASNGHEAVAKAFTSPPDLILMDLWMPVVDGLEAIKQLQADGRTSRIPVLALSAQSQTPDARTALAAGAYGFVNKPCDPDVLLEHIRLAMGGLRGA